MKNVKSRQTNKKPTKADLKNQKNGFETNKK